MIQHRYFQHQTRTLDDGKGGTLFVKDLDLLTGGEVIRDNILLIDNFIYSFAFNLENGIPVQHWYGDKNDCSLLQIMQYLTYIKDFDNLAKENDQIFEFRKILSYIPAKVKDFIYYYYSENNSSFDATELNDFEEDDILITESSHHRQSEQSNESSHRVLLGSDSIWKSQEQQKTKEVA